MRYARTNELIGTYTLDLMCSWYPEPARPVVRKVVQALIDDDMTRAFGFPWQPRAFREAAYAALRMRSKVVRWLPVRRRELGSRGTENRTYPGYPEGYRPADLGACPIQPRDRVGACPVVRAPAAGSTGAA
jgi:hypothetical protein